MMDVQERAEESWNNDRSDVMSAFLMRMSEFFCPPDRELALRGQIKTGWSTVAARKKSRQSQMKLPPQELKHIREVVAQAEALQVAEELRIGVQMLKLQRLRNSCRGNGTSSCILCGHDFQHHRSRSPISLHFCHECGQAVCSRCKSEYKCHTGNTVVLCRLCSDQRELWKKSGAWLSNKLPVVNFSEEELDRVQQQRQVQKVVPLRTEFMVSPSRLEDDDETEDDLSTISGSTANYGGFPYLAGSAPSSRSPSPDMSFMSEANAAAAAWRGNRPPSTELHPKSQGPLPHQLSMTTMRKSGSYDLVAIHKQKASALPSQERSMTMVRKQAMSGEKKKDMEESRRKVVERKKASEQKRSLVQDNPRMPSPPILSVELTQVKPSQSSDLPVVNSRLSPMMLSSPHPHIKVVMATPPTSPDILGGENRSESTLVEKRVASEPIPKVPKPDSTTVQSSVSSETPPAQQPKQSDSDATSAVGKKRKPVPSPRKKQQTSDSELRATTTTTQQEPTQEPVEFKRIVTSNVEGRKYGTLEREKKPTAAPRKRSSSLDKEKSREYKSGTLERKQRASKTPEPQPFEFKKVASPSKETSLGGSEPNTASPSFTAVLPADVSKELARELQTMKQAPPDVSPSMKDEGLPTNPTLREIGKTSTVAPDASVDSIMEPSDRNDSTGSGDHKWQRKGAKRVGGRPRRTAHTTQQDFEDDDPSPRTRTRSGAVSGGSSAAAMRSHQHNTTEEESHSRSRTRSGAMSGSDAVVLRRGHHGKTSPRPAHRVVRSGPLPERDHGDFPEPPFGNEPENSEEAVSMRRARNAHRRAARTGSDFLVATDGERD